LYAQVAKLTADLQVKSDLVDLKIKELNEIQTDRLLVKEKSEKIET
jgi:hypothetical protein